MKRTALVVVGLALLLSPWAGNSRSAAQDKVAKLMQQKLKHSQELLAGLALNDFKKIEKNADELIEISRQAEWKAALKTPDYEVYSNDFRRIAGRLAESARKKNLDAAALSYVDLTLTCVKCHKHVREARMARTD
jgi:hypothetical protein